MYGQGNFLLDDVTDENWHSGLMIEVTIENDDSSLKYIPVLARDHKVIVHSDCEAVIETFIDRSRKIERDNTVEALFSEFSDVKLSDYLIKLSGKRRLIQRVFRRLGIAKRYKKLYSKEACNMILDYLYCDTHRESIEFGLRRFTQGKRTE